jgi:hypothetical protein
MHSTSPASGQRTRHTAHRYAIVRAHGACLSNVTGRENATELRSTERYRFGSTVHATAEALISAIRISLVWPVDESHCSTLSR